MKLEKENHNTPPELDMTPMIDVVFQLIIFFMLITDMSQKELEELYLPKAEVDDILSRCDMTAITPKTICTPAKVRSKIAEARDKGYALTVEETVVGELVVAGAILNGQGRPIAAVH